jgi:putative transposase
MIDIQHEQMSIRQQCAVLGVNRSSFYYVPRPLLEDTDLANEIHDVWLEIPSYGYRRVTEELQRRGYLINSKKVLRLMRDMKLQAIYPRPKTSLRSPSHPIYPYLLRGLDISSPNQVWATDITYIKMPVGFAYLVAIIDVYSRYVLSWRLSNTMDTHFCLEMLEEALQIATPDIINTDQGSQFTSNEWVAKVEGSGAKVSMDGKGRWADNIYIERFWRSLKHEHVLLYSYEDLRQARRSIGGYMEIYNHRRLHQSLGYKTPAEVYSGHKDLMIEKRENLNFLMPDGYVDNLTSKLPTYPQAQHQPLPSFIG